MSSLERLLYCHLETIPGIISTATFIGSLGILFLSYRMSKANTSNDTNIKASEGAIVEPFGDDYKMVMLVRKDLNMTKGKIAAQCGHAVLSNYKQAIVKFPKMVEQWEYHGTSQPSSALRMIGQAKIALKVTDEQELLDLIKKAKLRGLCASHIRDAGRTQVASGTITVGCIGPAPVPVINEITRHLSLL